MHSIYIIYVSTVPIFFVYVLTAPMSSTISIHLQHMSIYSLYLTIYNVFNLQYILLLCLHTVHRIYLFTLNICLQRLSFHRFNYLQCLSFLITFYLSTVQCGILHCLLIYYSRTVSIYTVYSIYFCTVNLFTVQYQSICKEYLSLLL